jgi:inner membrane protein
MDDITHALVGWAVAETGPARRWGRPATWALVLSSLVPDVDGLVALGGTSTYLVHHRGFTHALIGWLPTALAVALPVWRFGGRRDFRPLLGLSLLGVALHVVCDSVNAWGVMPLYPFSMKRWQLDWVFLIDLVFAGCCLAGAALSRWRASVAPARVGLAALAAYVGLCGAAHELAVRRTAREAASLGHPAAVCEAMPMPPCATRWSGIARSDSGTLQVWFDLFGREVQSTLRENPSPDDLRRLAGSADGRAFLWFARFPVVVRESGRSVFFDARFKLPPGWPDRRSFAIEIRGQEPPRWLGSGP